MAWWNESSRQTKLLAQNLQLTDDLKWIDSQIESFSESMEEATCYNDLHDDFLMPVQKPIVKKRRLA